MIESIKVSGIATYHGDHVFGPLAKINFVFGCNGSGKTTLARIIADPSTHSSCSINWKAKPLQAYVYDRDFIAANFKEDLPGVFTLGTRDVELLEKIRVGKEGCVVAADKVRKLNESLNGDGTQDGEVARLATLKNVFQGKCWRKKQDHYETFKKAMKGYARQDLFMDKVLEENVSNTAPLLALDALKAKANKLFDSDIATSPAVPTIDVSDLVLLEQREILSKRVIGKADVNIAEMINVLGNSDWVDQGRAFFAKNEKVCPFCQQAAPLNLKQKLEEYFDKSFKEDSAAIVALEADYRRIAKVLQDEISTVIASASKFLDGDRVKKEQQLIDARVAANLLAIEGKKREPSQQVVLQSIEDVCKPIIALIVAANAEIEEHNTTVANLASEQAALTAEVWRFIVEELKSDIPAFEADKLKHETAITAIGIKLKAAEKELKDLQDQLHADEKSATSVRPTIKEINDILASFGFQGYKLAEGKAINTYQIVRANGQPANLTLSEGEKTFLTFLYFYHLLGGSNTDAGTLDERVVVFDDPVSSLDSNVLFIVSSLIRKLFTRIHTGSNVKQIIILTHNVFFHKEVSFKRRKDSTGNRKYWVVRKVAESSHIDAHDNIDPVKSSYELLWSEIKLCDGTPASVHMLQNAMRRILETYFGVLGGIDIGELDISFAGNDQLLCRSLLAWVQDGSHTIHDGLHMADTGATAEMFISVFRGIFEKTNHLPHYQMMMGEPLKVAEPLPVS